MMLTLCWDAKSDTYLGEISPSDERFLFANFQSAPDKISAGYNACMIDRQIVEYTQGLGMSPELAEMLMMSINEQESRAGEKANPAKPIEAVVYCANPQ